MVKVINKSLPSRRKLASPYTSDTFYKRLVESGAVDLRNNCKEIDIGSGYVSVQPIKDIKLK